MIEVRVSLPQQVFDQKTFADAAAAKFGQFAFDKVKERIAQRPGAKYQILVDRKLISEPSQILNAKRLVRLDFIEEIVERALLDLNSMVAALRESIVSKTSNTNVWKWIDRDRSPPASVFVLYLKAGETKFRQIGRGGQLDSFGPGDVIMLVPDMTTQMYLNTKTQSVTLNGRSVKVPTGGGGFMRAASAKIRRNAGLVKKQGVIWVAAVRSIGVYHHMINGGYGLPVLKRTGQPITPAIRGAGQTRGDTGAWAIMIKYREGAARHG